MGFSIVITRLIYLLNRIRNFYHYLVFKLDPLVIYGIIIIGSVTIAFSLRYIRLQLFIGPAWDTAYYLQALLRLSQFDIPISNFINFISESATNLIFGHRFSYSTLLYIPLFWLSDSPLFIGMFLIPFITLILTLYWWQQLFPSRSGLLWAVIGLVSILWSPFSGILNDEFYFDTFSIPWLLSSLLFLRTKREIPLLISLFIFTGFKDYFATYSALACFMYYIDNQSKKVLWAGCFFTLYFLIITFVAIPYFYNNESAIQEVMTGTEIKGFSTWLSWFIDRALDWKSLKYLFNFFGTFLFIPLISPKISLLALPILAINCIYFQDAALAGPHYHIVPNTIIAVAFVDGCTGLNERIMIWRNWLVQFITIIMILVVFCYYGYIPSLLSKRLSEQFINSKLFWHSSELIDEKTDLSFKIRGVRNTLYRLREDLINFQSQPDYISEIRVAISKVDPSEEISISPKLAPYVLNNSAWIFPRPFNQKNDGNRIKRVIIAKHHQSYLKAFNGNIKEFYKYIELLEKKYNLTVEINSRDLVVLIKKIN